MSLELNYESIAAHIKDYIDGDKFFNTFETQDIEKILKISQLSANDFITLLKQSRSTINANKLYECTRATNVSVQNLEEVVAILKSVKKYMKLRIFDGIIDVLIQIQNDISDSTEKSHKITKK
ncbi:hypothetical protein TVAG_467330 [Trichomonas vaginalis G3]|uniref:Uncharacterized protein n=1 Tax=Trichomonas vaginalis (strain ATCC PRA-98 / G3) TaxID=412133 RepID=A2FQD9_TRIV3|nr:ankyrin repeats (many copies)-containing protein [Trichomonas vaginalis G3]EAX92886.1 hypothetical protein TVAG_467330 [Trichomonas vaginalis G3]KAI5494013.1 ankyrin repeats (many copies)-containing protein [Trichomonas vaginalis G3]|eukprot:XP_001305816.1 hypothetical protein [Trichomonas vaginalis G3]